MKNKWLIGGSIILIMAILIISIVVGNSKKENKVDNGKFQIVTSFYPIYMMTVNITQGAKDIELTNMADTNVGCLHDYTLSTNDMKKIEKANIFIQNGLGLEKFMDKITNTNKQMTVINSSKDIMNLIENNQETNPHIWTSLENVMKQVKTIGEALAEKNPENADVYKNNTQKYLEKLTDLKLQFDIQLQNWNGKKVVCLNEAFVYMLRDLKTDYISVETNHEESTLSAEKLKGIIEQMKQENIKAIIVDENDNLKNAEMIAAETGAKIYKLDSALTGSLSKDSYLNAMQGNLSVLKTNI